MSSKDIVGNEFVLAGEQGTREGGAENWEGRQQLRVPIAASYFSLSFCLATLKSCLRWA